MYRIFFKSVSIWFAFPSLVFKSLINWTQLQMCLLDSQHSRLLSWQVFFFWVIQLNNYLITVSKSTRTCKYFLLIFFNFIISSQIEKKRFLKNLSRNGFFFILFFFKVIMLDGTRLRWEHVNYLLSCQWEVLFLAK